MSIAIICTNKDPLPWVAALKELDASLDIQVWPNVSNESSIEFALCWKHPEGVLRDYPNLKCICSMGAGIDHLLNDPFFPNDIPVIRIIDPLLAQSMFEYVCTAAMYFFRDFDRYQTQQRQSTCQQLPPKSMAEYSIGIMGLGKLGEHSALQFSKMGFNVLGWSRSQKSIAGITTYAGNNQLDAFLSKTNLLICLLPLTNETQGLLNLENFRKLPSGTCLVNVARGAHLVEADLIIALNEGSLRAACLDVFNTEPLEQDHPFWHNSKILISPHCSSITDPKSVAPQILENYRLMTRGKALINLVDIHRGY